jgi:SH3-like domain-containing protein
MAQTKPTSSAGQIKTNTARIVEDVPDPQIRLDRNMVRVSAEKTPSGFRVPRYVSLKYGTSNGRTGPSRGHPVEWRYKKRGLPMIIVAETEVWRKVRDVNGDESWMDRRLLDGKRMALARTEIILRAKPRSDSKQRAIAAKGALLQLEGCDVDGWCRVRSEAGDMHGYALQNLLWGAEPL